MLNNLKLLFSTIGQSDLLQDEKLRYKKEVLKLVSEMLDEIPNLIKHDTLQFCFSDYPTEITDMIAKEYGTGVKKTNARLHIEANAVLLARICERFNVPPVIPGYNSRITAEDDATALLQELVINRKL